MRLAFKHENHKEFTMVDANGKAVDVILDGENIYLCLAGNEGYFQNEHYKDSEFAEYVFNTNLSRAKEEGRLL